MEQPEDQSADNATIESTRVACQIPVPIFRRERETVFCFLDFHDTRDVPRKTQHPVMDLRVSGQQAESAKPRKL